VIHYLDDDYVGIQTPHEDALVVTLAMVNFEVKTVLIDNRGSANIMYYDVFEKMKLERERLNPIDSPLHGFSGEPIQVEGSIELLVTAKTTPLQFTVMVKFLVVRLHSAYNMII
ncbi:hypothetical protein CFOL_v3_09811, partial [Cephalotus follicularis]